jgi:hypothetical protein
MQVSLLMCAYCRAAIAESRWHDVSNHGIDMMVQRLLSELDTFARLPPANQTVEDIRWVWQQLGATISLIAVGATISLVALMGTVLEHCLVNQGRQPCSCVFVATCRSAA